MKNKVKIFLMILMTLMTLTTDSFSQPQTEWIKVFGSSANDLLSKSAVDNEGNILITGFKNNGSQTSRLLSAEGNIIAEKNQNLLNTADYFIRDLVVGQSGYHIMLIDYKNYYGNNYAALWKFNSDLTWNNAAYFSGDNGQAESNAFAISNSGYFYVAGNYINSKGESIVYLLKYSQLCQKLWEVKIPNLDSKNNKAISVAADNKNFIYLLGKFDSEGSSEISFLNKYSENGKLIWSCNSGIELSEEGLMKNIRAELLRTDNNGNIFIAGSCNSDNGKDIFIVKLNENGNREWTYLYDYDEKNTDSNNDFKKSYSDTPIDMETDLNGDLIVSGYSETNGSGNIFTSKIGSSRIVHWTNTFKTGDYPVSENKPSDLAIDKQGNVYVTGYQRGLNLTTDYDPGKDALTIKYSPEGKELWHVTQNGNGDIGSNDDFGKYIHLNDNNEIYVTGQISGFPDLSQTFVVKYSDKDSEIKDVNNNPETVKLYSNFPNPFNPSTKISFEIPEASQVSLKIYDITGREVASLINGYLNPGIHEINWNAGQLSSGVYFYKLQTGSFSNTRKMHLIK